MTFHSPNITNMKYTLMAVAALACAWTLSATAEKPVSTKIEKKGTFDIFVVEANPVVFKGKPYLMEYIRDFKNGLHHRDNLTGDSYFRFLDLEDMKTVTPAFAPGLHFGNAFVHGDRVYVTATPGWGGGDVLLTESDDLVHWTEPRVILSGKGWKTYNTTMCRAGDTFVLSFELGEPLDMVGEGFTMFFAVSHDLKTWKVVEGAVMGKDRYTGAPMLRYHDGWFYFFHLERDGDKPGCFVTRVSRSRNLRKWELSPKTVLGYDDEDRKLHPAGRFSEAEKSRIATAKNVNASDLDMCEYGGKLRLFYSWGDQNGNEFSSLAEANCTEQAFCESFFDVAANRPDATPLTTPWGEKVTAANAWREYPRPQMVRPHWTCLNGTWQYAVTETTSREPGPKAWEGTILVPYAIESKLSGVRRMLEPDQFLWYRRSFRSDVRPGERLLLNFEAVDYRTQVFVNGREATDIPHEGGDLPFSLDVTDLVRTGENELVVKVWDPTDTFLGASGKQSMKPEGCFYTRSSGIVGTVWTEVVPRTHLRAYRVTADRSACTATVRLDVAGGASGARAEVILDGRVVATAETRDVSQPIKMVLPKPIVEWSPASPRLYGLKLTLTAADGGAADAVEGYFGVREITWACDANGFPRFCLNGKPFYLMATLDQGWWPDGLLTPPSDEAMRYDVEVLRKCGFNALRKHIKVEPRRFYRYCDEIGFLLLQDMPSGKLNGNLHGFCDLTARYGEYRRELKEMVDHLGNHPSIVMWVPYNEGWGQTGAAETRATLRWLKAYDPTRLVDGPSGYNDYEGGSKFCGTGPWIMEPCAKAEPTGPFSADTLDIHWYPGPAMPTVGKGRVAFLGEFGGLGWRIEDHLFDPKTKNWGYDGAADRDKTTAYLEMIKALEGFASRGLGGSVYTQTTDVESEINGLMTYDRRVLKYDAETLKKAHEKVYEAVGR